MKLPARPVIPSIFAPVKRKPSKNVFFVAKSPKKALPKYRAAPVQAKCDVRQSVRQFHLISGAGP